MEEEKILNVTQLGVVDKLQNKDVILLIRDTGNGKQCFQIKGFDFRGESAYEAAQSQGFEGTYQEWVQQIKEVTEYDTKSLLSFNGIVANDANSALRSGIYPSVTTNVPMNGETFTIQTLRTTTAVFNQYVSTQIAIGVTGAAIGKVYIRKNTQKSGGTTYGDWLEISNVTSTTKKSKPKTQYIIGKAIPIGNLNGGARLNAYAVAKGMLQLKLTRLSGYGSYINWKKPLDDLDKSKELLKDVTWHIFVDNNEVVTGKLGENGVSVGMVGAYLRIIHKNFYGFYSLDESKSSLELAPDMYIYLEFRKLIYDNFKGTSDTFCFHEGVKVWTPKGNIAPYIVAHNRFYVKSEDTVQLQKLLTNRHGSKWILSNAGVVFHKISYRGQLAEKELTQYGVYRYRIINERKKTRWYTVNIMKNGNNGKSELMVKK